MNLFSPPVSLQCRNPSVFAIQVNSSQENKCCLPGNFNSHATQFPFSPCLYPFSLTLARLIKYYLQFYIFKDLLSSSTIPVFHIRITVLELNWNLIHIFTWKNLITLKSTNICLKLCWQLPKIIAWSLDQFISTRIHFSSHL